MVVVEGKLTAGNGTALFRTSAACAGIQPVGEIFGSARVVIGGKPFEYVFLGNEMNFVEGFETKDARQVVAEFKNVKVTNLTRLFTVRNGVLYLETFQLPGQKLQSLFRILRPGRADIELSGRLSPGVMIIPGFESCGEG
ncbi:MAG: hypothetical protein ACM3QZ_00590 [Solirubrobacterales bacterium]